MRALRSLLALTSLLFHSCPTSAYVADDVLARTPLKAYFANHTYLETIPVGQYLHAHSENVGYYVAGDPNAKVILEMGVPYGGGGQDGVHIVCAQAAREYVSVQTSQGLSYAVVVRWMGWGGVAVEPIFPCNKDKRSVQEKCPDVLMLGTTQIAGRVKTGDIVHVSEYMSEWFVETGRFLQDDFRKGTYYDYFLKDLWRAVPLISDIRVLAVNVTAFQLYDIPLPPPLGKKYTNALGGNWTWDAMTEMVLQLHNQTNAKSFTMLQDYQEGLKTIAMMMRSARVSMFDLKKDIDGGCGFANPRFHDIFDRTFRKIYDQDAFTYCAFGEGSGLPICDQIDIRTRLAGLAILPVQWFFEYKRVAALQNLTGIELGFVPGFTTFLGGSGLAITNITHRPGDAWRLMSYLFDSNNRYITQIGIATSSPPPYESIALLPEWNTPQWKVILEALPAAVPEQWPEQTFPELNAVEGQSLDRTFLIETFHKKVPTKQAADEVCKGFVKAFAKACSPKDYTYKVSQCTASNTFEVDFEWKQPQVCVNITMQNDIGTPLPDKQVVECPYVVPTSGVAMGIFAFSGVGIGFSVIFSGLLIFYRNTATVKASSPLFTHLTLLGSILIYVSSILQAGDPVKMTCTASVWVFVYGFALTFGSLFVKIFRIYRIFTNKTGQKRKLGAMKLLAYIIVILALETAVLLAYELAPGHPYIATKMKEIPGIGSVEISQCTAPNSLTSLALVFLNLMLLLVTCTVAFLCRKVPPQYQEAKVVGIIVYAASFILIVIVPVLFYISGSGLVQAPFMLFGLASNFTTLSSMFIFCGSKLHTTYLETTGQIVLSKTGGSASSSRTSQAGTGTGAPTKTMA